MYYLLLVWHLLLLLLSILWIYVVFLWSDYIFSLVAFKILFSVFCCNFTVMGLGIDLNLFILDDDWCVLSIWKIMSLILEHSQSCLYRFLFLTYFFYFLLKFIRYVSMSVNTSFISSHGFSSFYVMISLGWLWMKSLTSKLITLVE